MKMQHAAMRDVMLASGARKVRMHDSRPTPALPMQRCNGNCRMSRKCNWNEASRRRSIAR